MGVGRLARRERVSEKGTIIIEALKCAHLPSVCYITVAKIKRFPQKSAPQSVTVNSDFKII